DVIRDCVVASPYTLPVERNGISEDSGPVYFLKYGDSALILETTIWIPYTTSYYVATTDMNLRVNKAFKEHGIEIPYNFVNVVERDNTAPSDNIPSAPGKKRSPSKRHFRTDTIVISPGKKNLKEAVDMVRSFASTQRLDEKSKNQLSLMTEELIGITGDIVDDTKAKLWIEGSGLKYRIHLNFKADIGSGERVKLLALSSSGKNEADNSLPQKIWEKVLVGLRTTDNNAPGSSDYEWSLNENGPTTSEIGESILVALADDIKVSVTKSHVELVVIKAV
ncbi:MAG: mechanosensitive ion channel, partial [Lachnospiraceae bacterium]|nr:mechanosensitive ion channel [Lachnospiraceae bacterium]